jgi:hypothetical protein
MTLLNTGEQRHQGLRGKKEMSARDWQQGYASVTSTINVDRGHFVLLQDKMSSLVELGSSLISQLQNPGQYESAAVPAGP